MLTPFYISSIHSEDDIDYVQNFCGNIDKSQLPLRLALFISPLYLLVPKLLHKTTGRAELLEVMEVSLSFNLYVQFSV